MGNKEGFLKYDRELPQARDPKVRINDFNEIYEEFPEQRTQEQAARCMDCGVPFCHQGCPLGNIIPEFNDAVYREQWEEAIEILTETNNFPEFTGRICPAPCEASCVLGINKPPVAIEHIEKTIAEKAYELGYIKPNIPEIRTDKKVAIIGSGPAGLSAAAQLNQAGHRITVYEREDQIGGLLRYGIPDFKLEKWVIDRRLEILKKEGIEFVTQAEVGKNVSTDELEKQYDAIVLCVGSTVPRDLPIKGRDLDGIYFAMDFLTDQNRNVYKKTPENVSITAKDKHVVVIGGGDTGSDCIGTSHRQGAKSVLQIELLEKPLDHRTDKDPWPNWPMVLRTSSSHEEGGERAWSMLTKAFIGDDQGRVKAIKVVDIAWTEEKNKFEEVEGTEREIPCDLALLAVGFVTPENNVLKKLGIDTNKKGLIESKKYQTNKPHIFSAGDARRGQSLVVWAQSEGREAAVQVDKYLMGSTSLPSKQGSFLAVKK
ncbi:glutamate synthase subunit beta [Fulvivirga sp. RKSG066]|uniref:glutamate synthase subunit beta n=1 Tax=Fulvivirga aurantia TaxID=2529383 RepID=UPI0012BCADE0|nr:glutamate synthase subunit beta [Fulvivirga aurantia]MTI22704.1 glutamate synthase subunit beta [Fulvivirga aurantia]